MTHPTHEELISAYFDGEATAAERAEAMRLLKENAEARAWWDELQRVRGEIQSLPKVELGENFSEQVLRRAERAMLLEAAEVAGDDGRANLRLIQSNGRPRRGGNETRQLPRARSPWFAPAWLSAAASLLLFAGLLFQPGAETRRARVAAIAPAMQGLEENAAAGRIAAIEEKSPAATDNETFYFALGTAGSAGGQVVVVCDVNGQPRDAVEEFEKLLNRRREIDRRLGLSPSAVETTLAKSKGKGESTTVAEAPANEAASSTRVYFVSMAPQQLAATLREVNALGNSEISISGFSAPSEAPAKRLEGEAAEVLAAEKKDLKDRDATKANLLPETLRSATPTIFVLRLNNAGQPAAGK